MVTLGKLREFCIKHYTPKKGCYNCPIQSTCFHLLGGESLPSVWDDEDIRIIEEAVEGES